MPDDAFDDSAWVVLFNRSGVVEGVDGGAPAAWIGRRAEECAGMSAAAVEGARLLLRAPPAANSGGALRRLRVPPSSPIGPSYSLLAVEAVFLHPAEIGLESLVREALAPLRRQAEVAGVGLELEVGADVPPTVNVDAEKVRWAVTAVVGNALRYVLTLPRAGQGGSVRVRLHAGADMAAISVEDDGPGIPRDLQRSLLVRAPTAGETTGLALRLVHDVVAAHGGGVVIKSRLEPDGLGTVVTLWLPVQGEGPREP